MTRTQDGASALASLELPARDSVQAWCMVLSGPGADDAVLEARLSPEERDRARSLRHPDARRRFTRSHHALRSILGAYLDCPGESLGIVRDERGKPRLAGPGAEAGVEFNLAHSRDLAVVAVAVGRQVGVDVEVLRAVPQARRLAERYLTASERAAIASAADTEAESAAFLRCWTGKEAYLKAVGEGLRQPLRSVEVTCLPGEPARVVSIDGDRDAAAGWHLVAFEPMPSAVAAVASPAPFRLEVRDLDW